MQQEYLLLTGLVVEAEVAQEGLVVEVLLLLLLQVVCLHYSKEVEAY
jgi:hypothetical protein